MKQNKKEVQSHVFEVVTFRSRLECWRCLDLHMSMRRQSSNPGCSVLSVVPMSCLRFSQMKSEKEHVSRECLRLSNGYAWDCLQFLTRHGCPHRSGHMVPHGDWPAGELRQCCKREKQVSNDFQGLENDLNRVSSIRACVVLRSRFLSTGEVLAGGLLEKQHWNSAEL